MSDLNENVLETFLKNFYCKKPSDDVAEDFVNRLLTFIEGQKWVSRLFSLSPSVCARYGWKCINPNLLECVTCGAKLSTQEPNIEVYDAYKACIEKIVTDLKDAHKTDCPWPLTPSPESFVKMIALSKEESLNQFLCRLKPCLEFEDSIPQVKQSITSELGLTEEVIHSLCKVAEISPEDSIGMSVVCIAATGWSLMSKKNGETKTCIKCNSCQRSIWVKSFNLVNSLSSEEASTSENGTNPEQTETSENDNISDSSRKRIKLERTDFDPLAEHRPWCLWISETNECKMPGWELFMKSLLRNVAKSENNNTEATPSKEHVRSVRNLLDSWSPTS